MITKEDIEILDKYFKTLTTIPEDLQKLSEKVELMNEIQIASDKLSNLVKESE